MDGTGMTTDEAAVHETLAQAWCTAEEVPGLDVPRFRGLLDLAQDMVLALPAKRHMRSHPPGE